MTICLLLAPSEVEGHYPKIVRKYCSGGSAVGSHLVSFRTQKLSPLAPMILSQCEGKVGSRRNNVFERGKPAQRSLGEVG